VMEAGSDRNWPKRRVLRRLGQRYVFFFKFTLFLILTNDYLYIQVLFYENAMRKGEGSRVRQKRAQTTLDASFGP
jgi:hypothetical protein